MKALLQRVKKASVSIDNNKVGKINKGILILLSIGKSDTKEEAVYLFEKIKNLRIFKDNEGKMNLSVTDISADLLLVSQFTLHADTTKGNRPSFNNAANPKKAKKLYNYFEKICRQNGFENIQTGEFGKYMKVSLINDGPVTVMVKSKNEYE